MPELSMATCPRGSRMTAKISPADAATARCTSSRSGIGRLSHRGRLAILLYPRYTSHHHTITDGELDMTVSDGDWTTLGAFDGDFADAAASGASAGLRRCAEQEGDRSARWLTTAMVALGVLARASA